MRSINYYISEAYAELPAFWDTPAQHRLAIPPPIDEVPEFGGAIEARMLANLDHPRRSARIGRK